MYKFLIAFLAVLLPILAQQGTGTISGSVVDPQGAAIMNAQVQVIHVGTQAVFRTVTNDSGNFIAPGLAVGAYEVQTEQQGFKKAVRTGIVLQVAQNARIDITMEIGQLAETVNVTAETALVDTSSPTLGMVVENRRLQDLPINGRNALAFTTLTAGVISNSGPAEAGFSDRGVRLSSVSVNGGPNALNAQMLDGNNNTLSFVGEVSIPPAVDSVEEFKVQSGPMSAEFGFTAGGAVNLVTKSGTNKYHGSLYEFLRNEKFDSRHSRSATKLPLRYNQFGGAIGGPILKNKLFGFINYEKYLLRRTTPRIVTVPLRAWKEGNYSDYRSSSGVLIPVYDPATTKQNPSGSGQVRTAFPGNVIPKTRFDSAGAKILSYWPEPNKTPINQYTQSQNYQEGGPFATDWIQWNQRVDYRINDRHSLFVRYTQAQHDPLQSWFLTDPAVSPARDDDQKNRNAVASYNFMVTPTTLNNLRVGLSRQAFLFATLAEGDWSSKLGVPAPLGQLAFPYTDFGFSAIGGGVQGIRNSNNWDIQNMTTMIRGNHSVKIGVNYRPMQGNTFSGNRLGGNLTFSGLTTDPQKPAGTGFNLAQVLLGEVSSASFQKIGGASWASNTWSAFVQDDWKVTRRLTLNLGLRWDWQQKPFERNDGQINFDLTKRDPVSGMMGAIVFAGVDGQPRSFVNESSRDFAPRFGWAWDMFGTGKTVFRGGYGVFYPTIFWRPFFGDTNFFSTTDTSYAAMGAGLRAFKLSEGLPFEPLGIPGRATPVGKLLGQGVTIREADGRTPLTQQWTASIQHDLKGWLFDVAYAGNKGNGFISSNYNLNVLPVDTRIKLGQSLNDSVPNPLAGKVPGGLGAATVNRERTLLPYPQYSGVGINGPRIGNYVSHQIQINIRRQFTNGFFASLAFTGGKKLSDSGITPTWDFGYEGTAEQSYQDGLYNRRLNRSLDPNDVSRRAAITLLYELPAGPGKLWNPSNGFVRTVVAGWQVNSIGVMQTGLPLAIRGASNFASDRPNSTGVSAKLDDRTQYRWFNTDAFVNPQPFYLGNAGRVLPDVRTPSTVNWDLSLLKNTRIGEGVNLQFRAEAFNFLNRVNLLSPNTTFTPGADGKNINAAFGNIASARDARVVQLGLKLVF